MTLKLYGLAADRLCDEMHGTFHVRSVFLYRTREEAEAKFEKFKEKALEPGVLYTWSEVKNLRVVEYEVADDRETAP